MSIRVWVVIPVYNHGATLRDVARRALMHCPDVLVVDDGSTDGGPDTLGDIPVRLVRLPRNRGKGAAIDEGARAAAAEGATHIVTLDADGQHYPEDLPRLLHAAQCSPHAVIVGSRDFNTPNVPAASRFGRAFSGFWMRVQTGLAVSDMQSGYRVYPLAALRRLTLLESGYAFEVEVLVRAAWAGFAIEEVPVRVLYPEASRRISHFKALRDNARMSLLNTRLTVRALAPIPFRRHALEAEGRISLRRPLTSLRLLLANPTYRATPAVLARSAAVAAAVSTLPIPGLQSILLLLCVGWFRLNRLCALAMAPLTWPPLAPGLAVLLGYRLRHGEWLTEFTLRTLGYEAPQRLWEWMLGSLVLAPLVGMFAGGVVGGAAWAAARSLKEQDGPLQAADAESAARTSIGKPSLREARP